MQQLESPRLGGIVGTTISAPELEAARAAYIHHLGFVQLDEGQISAEQAADWGCPEAYRARYVTLGPAGHRDFLLRLVENPAARGYRAFTTHGWNAAELIVTDVDGMAAALARSPFRIVGAPADLVFCTDIRAMQVIGPAGELLYLTQFKKPVPGFDVPVPRCPVDRVFIVILGGASLPAMQAFYTRQFGLPGATPMQSRVVAMAEAFGLDREHRFQIAALPLAGQSLIELDEMPAAAGPVHRTGGRLPPGIAIVSCTGRNGEASRSLIGAAGELLEVLGSGGQPA